MFLVVGYFAVSIPQIVYLKFNPWIILQIFIHWYGCFKKIFWIHWIQIQRTPIGLLMQLQVKQLVPRWKVMCTLSPRRIDHADLRMYRWHTVYPPQSSEYIYLLILHTTGIHNVRIPSDERSWNYISLWTRFYNFHCETNSKYVVMHFIRLSKIKWQCMLFSRHLC